MHQLLSAGKEDFLKLAVNALAANAVDFPVRMESITTREDSGPPHLAAGVLLLLHYRMPAVAEAKQGDFVFVLIKRSNRVAQPGDLSCPGGILHDTLDPLLRPLVSTGLLPIMRGHSRDLALQQGSRSFRLITLFLTNAVREAWEEIGLSPFNVRFLGAIPSYELILHRRIIFPLVAFMPNDQAFHPNDEVERIVEIPLNAFLDKQSYGRFIAVSSDDTLPVDRAVNGTPCLVHREDDGREEVLWGATFSVVMSFLKAVVGISPPEPLPERKVMKILPPEYRNGTSL